MYLKDWEKYNIKSTDLSKLLQFIYLKWTAPGRSDLCKYQTGSGAPQILPHLISNWAHLNNLAMDRGEVGLKLDAATAIS